jgi:hypothetical protein
MHGKHEVTLVIYNHDDYATPEFQVDLIDFDERRPDGKVYYRDVGNRRIFVEIDTHDMEPTQLSKEPEEVQEAFDDLARQHARHLISDQELVRRSIDELIRAGGHYEHIAATLAAAVNYGKE